VPATKEIQLSKSIFANLNLVIVSLSVVFYLSILSPAHREVYLFYEFDMIDLNNEISFTVLEIMKL